MMDYDLEVNSIEKKSKTTRKGDNITLYVLRATGVTMPLPKIIITSEDPFEVKAGDRIKLGFGNTD